MSAPSDPWVLELANLTDDELADPAIVMASDPRQAAMYRRWVRASPHIAGTLTAEPPDDPDQRFSNGHRPTASLAPPEKLLTIDELAGLAPPAWRITEVLPDQCLSVVFGRQSTYKNFAALDWCISVAAGVAWHGHDVHPGTVVYIAAEGGPGLLKRIRAWQATRPGADPAPRFRAIPRSSTSAASDRSTRSASSSTSHPH